MAGDNLCLPLFPEINVLPLSRHFVTGALHYRPMSVQPAASDRLKKQTNATTDTYLPRSGDGWLTCEPYACRLYRDQHTGVE